jgi:hypothetical protein
LNILVLKIGAVIAIVRVVDGIHLLLLPLFLACLGMPIISPGQSLVFMNPLKEYEGYFVHIVEHQWLLMQTGIQMKFFFMW